MAPSRPTDPSTGLTTSLDAILERFGVSGSEPRTRTMVAAEEFLTTVGVTARLVELRYGALIVETDPRSAAELGWERDRLLAHLAEQVPGAVRELRIRTTTR